MMINSWIDTGSLGRGIKNNKKLLRSQKKFRLLNLQMEEHNNGPEHFFLRASHWILDPPSKYISITLDEKLLTQSSGGWSLQVLQMKSFFFCPEEETGWCWYEIPHWEELWKNVHWRRNGRKGNHSNIAVFHEGGSTFQRENQRLHSPKLDKEEEAWITTS